LKKSTVEFINSFHNITAMKVKRTSKSKKKAPLKKTPVQKTSIQASKPDDGTVKSKIMTCIVTGIERRVSKAGIVKGIKKFDSLGSFCDNYVSNEAKRLLKQRVSPEEVQKQLRPSHLKPFEIDHKVLARLKLLKKPRHKRLSEQEATAAVKAWKPAERRFYTTTAEFVLDNTKNGSCIAPKLYLDSDRVCDNCPYKQWCQSTAKQFSKKYKG